MPKENSGSFIITDIKKYKNSVKLLFKDNQSLLISGDDYVSSYYYVGKELSLDDIAYLNKSKERQKLYKYAYTIALNNRYTEAKLRDKLHLKSKDKEVIDKIIDKLKNIHLIDDIEFVKDFVSLENDKHYGYKKIISDLLEKGISKEYLSSIEVNTTLEREKALYWLEKGENKYTKYNTNKKKALFYNFLLQKGFSNEIAKEVTNKLKPASLEDNESLCKKEYEKVKTRLIKKYKGKVLKEKIIASLLSKGYSIKDIMKVMED